MTRSNATALTEGIKGSLALSMPGIFLSSMGFSDGPYPPPKLSRLNGYCVTGSQLVFLVAFTCIVPFDVRVTFFRV